MNNMKKNKPPPGCNSPLTYAGSSASPGTSGPSLGTGSGLAAGFRITGSRVASRDPGFGPSSPVKRLTRCIPVAKASISAVPAKRAMPAEAERSEQSNGQINGGAGSARPMPPNPNKRSHLNPPGPFTSHSCLQPPDNEQPLPLPCYSQRRSNLPTPTQVPNGDFFLSTPQQWLRMPFPNPAPGSGLASKRPQQWPNMPFPMSVPDRDSVPNMPQQGLNMPVLIPVPGVGAIPYLGNNMSAAMFNHSHPIEGFVHDAVNQLKTHHKRLDAVDGRAKVVEDRTRSLEKNVAALKRKFEQLGTEEKRALPQRAQRSPSALSVPVLSFTDADFQSLQERIEQLEHGQLHATAIRASAPSPESESGSDGESDGSETVRYLSADEARLYGVSIGYESLPRRAEFRGARLRSAAYDFLRHPEDGVEAGRQTFVNEQLKKLLDERWGPPMITARVAEGFAGLEAVLEKLRDVKEQLDDVEGEIEIEEAELRRARALGWGANGSGEM